MNKQKDQMNFSGANNKYKKRDSINIKSLDLKSIKRGDIFLADLNPVIGSEQGGIRPVVIIQNNAGNQYSDTVIVASISSKSKNMPTHVKVKTSLLFYESYIYMEQIRTIDKKRLLKYICHIKCVEKINQALKTSVGLN